MRLNDHVLSRDDDVLKRALDFIMVEKRMRGRPNITRRKQVGEEIKEYIPAARCHQQRKVVY